MVPDSSRSSVPHVLGVEDAPQNDRLDRNVKSCTRQKRTLAHKTGERERANRERHGTWPPDRRAPRGGANRDKTSMPQIPKRKKRGGPQTVGRPAAFVSRSLGLLLIKVHLASCLLVVFSETSRRPPESDGLPDGEHLPCFCLFLLYSLFGFGDMP